MAPAQDYRYLAAALILAALCGSGSSFLCPPGYYAIESRCFMFVKEPYTWEDAQINCGQHGGGLAVKLDRDTHALVALLFYIQENPLFNDTHIWLGGSDTSVEGTWRWNNGDYISMNPLFWHHDCAPRGDSRHKMASARDYSLAAALVLAALCGSGSSFLCPPNYYAIETRCLKFERELYYWEMAKIKCRPHGGSLAQYLDRDTHALAALLFYLQSDPQLNETNIWLGGSDISVEGRWVWLSNRDFISMNPLFWHHNEPVEDNEENCLSLSYKNHQYKFSDETCLTKLPSICSAPRLPGS